MKLYLVRHGQAFSNISDTIVSQIKNSHKSPLTPKGIDQSLNLGQDLSEKNIDLVLASDFLRTMQTAYLLGGVIGTRVEFDIRLREKNMGDWEGRKFSEFIGTHNPETLWHTSSDNVEPYQDIAKRAESFLQDLEKIKTFESLAIVSHGDILLIMRRFLEGKRGRHLAPVWGQDEDSFDNAEVFECQI